MTTLDSIMGGLGSAWQSVRSLFSQTPVASPITSCPHGNGKCKTVSEKTKKRLEAAQDAITYAKSKLSYGAGNQLTALEETNFNSYYRMEVARNDGYFNIPPEVQKIRKLNEASFIAAKAELAQGGNCGEHAFVVFDYLRRRFPDEHIQVGQIEGLDHAFVLIGDPAQEDPSQIVVADAWPTDPVPVLWEDHFAYSADPDSLLNHFSSKGDSRDYKSEMLKAGLSLNASGLERIKQAESQGNTQSLIRQGAENHWIWNHSSTASSGGQFEYIMGGTGPP